MIILPVLSGLLLLLLCSGGYMFLNACVRRKELPWFEKEELAKTPYGRYYETILDADQWLREHHAQDVWIESYDGLKLHGHWVAAKNPVGTVLLVHGYRSTKLVDFGVAFDYYHEKGLNLLIPDQRCHGKSEGKYITFGIKESRDMLSWILYHNNAFGEYPVLMSGMSMGATTVMLTAGEMLPENVCGVIADCGFTSPKDILSSVFKDKTHLPAAPTLWAADLFTRLFAGFSLNEKSTEESLSRTRLPVLLIHGTADRFVPCEMTKRSFAACSAPKKLLLVEGAGHGVSFLKDHERYTAYVEEFLKETIEKKEEF